MSEQIDRSEWPPWAEEIIVIEEPNLQWANIAEQEIKKLRGERICCIKEAVGYTIYKRS